MIAEDENLLQSLDPDSNFFSTFNPINDCKYYTVSDFNSVLHNQIFSVLNFNIRSFNANSLIFESFLQTITLPFDCIILTETWNHHNNFDLCNLDNFNCIHTFRTSSRGGGVSIFCREIYFHIRLDQFCLCEPHIETCAAQIIVKHEKYFILAVYRPPAGNFAEFLLSLETILSNISATSKIILAGDFNVNLTDLNNTTVTSLTSALSSFYLLPLISKPTRFPAGTLNSPPSTIDHIWSNAHSNYLSGIINFDGTDHLPTFSIFKGTSNNNNLQNMKKIQIRPYNVENFTKLKSKLLSTDWNTLLNFNCAETCFNHFSNILNKIYCDCFPLKTKFLSNKRLEKPWLNSEIKHLIDLKSNYFKNFRLGLISKETNNRTKNYVNNCIRKAKNTYYNHALNFYKNNSKKSWETIRQIIGKKKTRNEIIRLLDGDDLLTDRQDIANSFANFFSNIGRNLDNDLATHEGNPTSNINYNPRSFFIFPVTPIECEIIISNLKETKTHIDEFPIKLFKSVKSLISDPLCKIINSSFSSGHFPEKLKIARITPIHKQGDPENASNYRPISSLSYLSKIYERCMTNRLINFFEKFSLFTKSQFGFLKHKSTQDAILYLLDAIHDSLNNKNFHINISIDLKKAFDTVNHQILLNKLELYGVRGLGLDWIRNYLLNRQSYVRLDDSNSERHITNIGVPQGSIIGPFLFLIYINDLPNISNTLKSTLFADDTTFSFSHKDYSTMVTTLNSELTQVKNWTCINRLTLNTNKTELILFANRPFDLDDSTIQLGDSIISYVDSCKFLGVKIDNKLNFNHHINYILGKISRSAGILYRIRDSLTQAARLTFYYSFVYPYISYNIVAWGGTNKVHLKPLNIQHKRIIRTISNAGFLEHTSPLFSQLRILKLDDIYKFNLLLLTHKRVYTGSFNIQHSINTRHRNLAVPEFQRLTKTQQSSKFMGPYLWNTLPLEIKNLQNFTSFKIKLKRYFLSKYAE